MYIDKDTHLRIVAVTLAETLEVRELWERYNKLSSRRHERCMLVPATDGQPAHMDHQEDISRHGSECWESVKTYPISNEEYRKIAFIRDTCKTMHFDFHVY